MYTYKISDTVAVTTPIYCGTRVPSDCCHIWDDVPHTKAYHEDKKISLSMQRCSNCFGMRTKIVGDSSEDLDKAIEQ